MQRAISVTGGRRRNFWENHLRDWQADYCRKHGLSDKSFVYWKRRLVTKLVIKMTNFFIFSPKSPVLGSSNKGALTRHPMCTR